MNRLVGFSVAFLLGCGAASAVTGPIVTTWRGAALTGAVTPDVVSRVLEPAWQQTPRDWEPIGWTITMHVEPFDCPGHGLARGCTDTRNGRRHIDLVAVEAVAAWELCNARRWDVTHHLLDLGCKEPDP